MLGVDELIQGRPSSTNFLAFLSHSQNEKKISAKKPAYNIEA